MGCCEGKPLDKSEIPNGDIIKNYHNDLKYEEQDLKNITKIQAHIRGDLARKQIKGKNTEANSKNNCNNNFNEAEEEKNDPLNQEYYCETVEKLENELGKFDFSSTKGTEYENLTYEKSIKVGNNSLYSGQWKDGKMWGKGKLRMINGSVYEGF